MVALALAHRAWLACRSTTIAADGAFYLQSAKDLYEGNIQWAFASGFLHPLHMILTTTLGDLLGGLETGAYVLAVTASSLAVLPLVLLVWRFWNEKMAWGSGLIYALHPTLAWETSEVLNTSLYLSLLIGAVAFIIRATRDGPWLYYPLAGAFAGLCYLTRPEALILVVYFVVSVGVAVVRTIREKSETSAPPSAGAPSPTSWPTHVAGFLVATLVFCAFSLPYVVWLHRVTGKWRVTRRGAGDEFFKEKEVAMKLVMPPLPGPTVEPPAPPPSAPQAASDKQPKAPPTVPEKPPRDGLAAHAYLFQKKFRFALFAPFFALLLIGAFACRRQGGTWGRLSPLWSMALLAAAPPVVCLAAMPVFNLSERYLLPSVVFLIPWVAAGMSQTIDWISLIPFLKSRPPALRAVGALLCAGLLAMILWKTGGIRRPEEWTFVDAGRWLRENGPLTPRYVLSTSEKIPYFGGYRPYWVREGNPKVRWALENGTMVPAVDPAAPGTVSDRVKTVLEDYKRQNAAFLILHEKAAQHQYPAEFTTELERVGFQLRTTIDKGTRSQGTTVRIYQLK